MSETRVGATATPPLHPPPPSPLPRCNNSTVLSRHEAAALPPTSIQFFHCCQEARRSSPLPCLLLPAQNCLCVCVSVCAGAPSLHNINEWMKKAACVSRQRRCSNIHAAGLMARGRCMYLWDVGQAKKRRQFFCVWMLGSACIDECNNTQRWRPMSVDYSGGLALLKQNIRDA